MMVNKIMKGRINCPQCGKEFIAQAPENAEEAKVHCPFCNREFTVITNGDSQISTDQDDAECSWEEHGEPRKTILSSMKPRTDKPMLAAILLILVVIIGLASAALPQTFAETPLTVLSIAGVQEDIQLIIKDQNDDLLSNVTISSSSSASITTNQFGKGTLTDLPLGDQTVILTKNVSTTSLSVHVNPFETTSYTIIFDTQTSTATIENADQDLSWISAVLIIISIVALFSVISCIRRRHSDVAIVGSIVGIFTIGFFLIGSVLSIIAFILIFKSKEEFDDGKKGKSF